jgi:hypothetical protein
MSPKRLDPAPPPPAPAAVGATSYELEHWTRHGARAAGVEYCWARTILPDRQTAHERMALLRRLSMEPERMPPRGMPRASRLVLVERRVVEELLPALPTQLPLGRYKQPSRTAKPPRAPTHRADGAAAPVDGPFLGSEQE